MTRPLTLTALAAILLAALRAAHQSITIDEAATFVLFVQHAQPLQWIPSPNNHLLNTLGMRLAVLLFGVSEFSVRLPALLGSALYLAAGHRLCRLLTPSARVQVIAFLCLAANPFILDHLVAARGYSLALGFLMLAIVAYWDWRVDPRGRSAVKLWALISSALALCFTANFAFALVAAATFLVLLNETRGQWSRWLFAAALAPAAVIVVVLPLPALIDWPAGQLTYGATSVLQTFSTIYEATLFKVNPELLNPTAVRLFTNLKHAVLPLAAATALAYLAVLVRSRIEHPNLRLAGLLAGIAALALAAHAAAYYAFGLLLPRDRTGIFFVPLLTAALAAIVTTPGASPWRKGAIGAQALLAAYFLVCLRTDYFKEWPWNADSRRLYSVLACLHRRDGVERVAPGWHATSVLNFYRAADPLPTFGPVIGQEFDPPDPQVYAIDPFLVPGVMEARGLIEIYKDPHDNTRLAVPPAYAGLADSDCLRYPRPRSVRP
jgi:hypothetical protein